VADLKDGAAATAQNGNSFKERRRRPLPQPDFAPYIKANAYPGASYFFVGHSYNVDDEERHAQGNRVSTLSEFFQSNPECVPVPAALENEKLCAVLSRCERDLLHHLPEGALIGPAIDNYGKSIGESFTIWRKEMRRAAGDQRSN
jgi:hypothetical protein